MTDATTTEKDTSCNTKTCCFKRPIPLALLSTAVILAGGYSAMWYKQAQQLKTEVEKTLTRWNDSAVTGVAKEDFSLTYASISTAGFPTEIGVRINQPKLHYTGKAFKTAMDALAAKVAEKKANGQTPPVPTQFPVLEKWVEDIDGKGSLYLGGSYFTRTVRAKLEGATSGTSRFDDQQLPWTTKTENAALSCEVKVTRAAGLSLLKSNMLDTVKTAQDAMKYIEHAACGTTPYELIASDTQESLTKSAGTKFGVYITPEQDENILNGDVVVNIKDSEASKRFSDYNRRLSDAFASASTDATFHSVKQASMIGKLNVDINVHYRAPKEINRDSVGNADIVFKSFKVESGAMSLDWPLKIQISHGKENSLFNIDGDMRLKFTKEYDDALASALKGLPALAEGKNSPMAQSLAIAEKNAGGREKLEKALANLAPRASELGTIRLTTKAEFKGTNPKEGLAPSGMLKADVIQLMTDKYGMQLSGTAQLENVKVDLSLRCVNCTDMIDNTVGYVVAAQDVLGWVDPTLKSSFLDSSTPSKVKKFLLSISEADAKEPKTRIISIKDNGQGDVRVSGKGMLEVMMQWMQAFLPNGGPAGEMQKQMILNAPTESAPPKGMMDDTTGFDPVTGQPIIAPEGNEKEVPAPNSEAEPEATAPEAEAPSMSEAEPKAQDIEAEAKKAFEAKQ